MIKVDDPENPGQQIDVYTQAELDAQLLEKDNHVKTKLDEFQKGKTAQELKDIETLEAIKKANETAEQANKTAESVKADARGRIVNFMAEQFVGQDADLRTKLNDSFSVIEEGRKAKGLDIQSEVSIKEMMIQASKMSGIDGGNVVNPVFPMGPGMAPNFAPTQETISDQDNDMFLSQVGYQKDTPVKKD